MKAVLQIIVHDDTTLHQAATYIKGIFGTFHKLVAFVILCR